MYDNFKVINYSNSLVSPGGHARHLARMYNGDIVTGFSVAPGTGLQVVVDSGDAFVRPSNPALSTSSASLVSLIGATFPLAIPTPDSSNPRIDTVVLYVDSAVNLPVIDATHPPTSANLDGPGAAKVKIVSGTPAASPVAPTAGAIQSSVGAANHYTILADVRVDPGVSVIAANKTTDRRNWAKLTSEKIDFATLNGAASPGSSSASNSTSYGTLSTPASITVDVPSNGKVAIMFSARLYNSTTSDQTGFVTVMATGANTIAASDTNALAYKVIGGNADASFARVLPLSGLNPGVTTFSLQRRTTGGNLVVSNAAIAAVPTL